VQQSATESLKRAAALRATDWIQDGMRLGLGTGSTIRHLLAEIAARREQGELRDIVGVPTSDDTAVRAAGLGIPLGTLAEHSRLDLTIDGADEVDPRLDLVKGLGGALLREKIVATASTTTVIVVDAGKLVDRLGTRAPLPVEVDPFGAPIQERFLRDLGASPELRLRTDGSPLITDGGNVILDCRFPGGIDDPRELEQQLNQRPGVLENGLFVGIADHVVVARPEGVEVRSRREDR
jgi:ribose 5-phosphate isomerase A